MSVMQDTQLLSEVKSLKPEFEKRFIMTNFQKSGKDYIVYNGLVILAKAKGIKSLTNKIVQLPSPANDNTTIVESTLVGWDKSPDGTLVEVTYTGIGDANLGNCNKLVGKHAIRMAETRAKGRAMRDYVGIDAVMFEEIGDNPYQENDPNKLKITKQQVEYIVALKESLGFDKAAMGAYAFKSCGSNDIGAYTMAMGDKLIASMKEEVENTNTSPTNE